MSVTGHKRAGEGGRPRPHQERLCDNVVDLSAKGREAVGAISVGPCCDLIDSKRELLLTENHKPRGLLQPPKTKQQRQPNWSVLFSKVKVVKDKEGLRDIFPLKRCACQTYCLILEQ